MTRLPPAFQEAEFKKLNSSRPTVIEARYQPLVDALHKYLNQSPCISDLQEVRKRWIGEPRSKKAFGVFVAEPWHWYTYNHGGRNEAQFNIGLCETYLRIGLGFEFTKKRRGNPTAVGAVYSCVKDIIRKKSDSFSKFVVNNQIEIEWCPKDSVAAQYVPTPKVLEWIMNNPQECNWIFIGRLLKRRFDALILDDPAELAGVIETVFFGLRTFWEFGQYATHGRSQTL